MFNLEDIIDDIIDFINNSDGFIIVGWYKKGDISQKLKNEGK